LHRNWTPCLPLDVSNVRPLPIQLLPGLIFFNLVDIDNRNHPIVRVWNETVQNVAE
jgi:hypothetical protein